MHTLLPNTKYKIVTVNLAIPASDDAEITDGLNDLFISVCAEDWICDWQFPQQTFPVKTTSAEPEEGELFHTSAMEPHPCQP